MRLVDALMLAFAKRPERGYRLWAGPWFSHTVCWHFCHSDRSGGIWGFLAEDVRLSEGACCGMWEDLGQVPFGRLLLAGGG